MAPSSIPGTHESHSRGHVEGPCRTGAQVLQRAGILHAEESTELKPIDRESIEMERRRSASFSAASRTYLSTCARASLCGLLPGCRRLLHEVDRGDRRRDAQALHEARHHASARDNMADEKEAMQVDGGGGSARPPPTSPLRPQFHRRAPLLTDDCTASGAVSAIGENLGPLTITREAVDYGTTHSCFSWQATALTALEGLGCRQRRPYPHGTDESTSLKDLS
jgi:hypothetical protein